ncbi:putative glycoside hydrolase family 18, catalytic domain, glycoside hydrolase superfamily [Helianthus debilis subsp. tardiflorus]
MTLLVFYIFLSLQLKASSHTWIKSGYWYTGSEYPIPNINTALFTHLICAFAFINSSTHELVLLTSDEPYISSFTSTIKKSNPSVKPLLSIWTENEGCEHKDGNSSKFLWMTENPAYRKSFVESSIKMARAYGFEGLDLYVTTLLKTKGNMTTLGILFNEGCTYSDTFFPKFTPFYTLRIALYEAYRVAFPDQLLHLVQRHISQLIRGV